MSDQDLVKDHAELIFALYQTYTSNLLRGPVSRRVLDLAIQDLENLIAASENPTVKEGFEASKKTLEHFSKVSPDDLRGVEFNSPVDQAVRAYSLLQFPSCGAFGPHIADSKYVGQNPCRPQQYRAVQASDLLGTTILSGEAPNSIKHLKNALDTYLEQCKKCPYRALEKR